MTETTALATDVKPLSVFITNADSSAGRALVRQLVKIGVKVAGSTRNGTRGAITIRQDGGMPTYTDLSREADIKSTLIMTKADVVIDLGGIDVNHIPLAKGTYDVAKLDNVPVLNACHAVGVKKLVYVSWAAVYGDHGDHDDAHGHHAPAALDETVDVSRSNELFRAIARAESVLLKSDFNAVVLRAGYIYGDHSPALDAIAEAVQRGRSLPNGKGIANFIHTDDLASAILAVIHADTLPNRLYNIVDDTPISFDQFAEKLSTAYGLSAPTRMPILSDWGVTGLQEILLNQSFNASNARAKAELHWTPQYANQTGGLDRMLMYWRAEEATTDAPAKPTSTDLVKA